MAGSISRLSTRLGSLSLNFNKSITKSVLLTISPLKSSSESQVSSSLKRLTRDSSPIELLSSNGSITRGNCFCPLNIDAFSGIAELGANSRRCIYAFMTASLWYGKISPVE